MILAPRDLAVLDFAAAPDLATPDLTADSAAPDLAVQSPIHFYSLFAQTTVQSPSGMAVRDLNGDGRPDLAIASRSGSVALHLKSTGTIFQQYTELPAGVLLTSITGGRFVPGRPNDLVAADTMSGALDLLANDGKGAFTSAPWLTGTWKPSGLTAGDLDGDGLDDLVVTHRDQTSGYVAVLVSQGDGQFKQVADYPVGKGAAGVTLGDVNGDGAADILLADDAEVFVLLATGPAQFAVHWSGPSPTGPMSVAALDLDGDRVVDLAVTLRNGLDGLAVWHGRGDGTFAAPRQFPTGQRPSSLLAADFDGDGALDVATADLGSATVSVLAGNGQGDFVPAATLDVDGPPEALATMDLNGDGKLDLVTADDGGALSLLYNDSR